MSNTLLHSLVPCPCQILPPQTDPPQQVRKMRESKVFEAAAKGCIGSLQNLLKDDPLILDRLVVNSFFETPLHVAALLGHVDFVVEIIKIKPELINELNSEQSSPLHFAAAKGHVDVVRALLSVDSRTCLARDRNGLTPLHLAAMKGRIEVMKMLLQAQPEAAQLAVYRGENILHLCVKNNQLEALKLLLMTLHDVPEFVNARDGDGNTVLHLAVADKQIETIEFLLSLDTLQVNALNLDGKTAMDVLIRSTKDVRDSLVKEALTHARGFGTMETNIAIQHGASSPPPNASSRKDWLEKTSNALMVVASLIATMAFQAGVNPPSGVWQEDKQGYKAGSSILAHHKAATYTEFYIANTIAFIASLSIILLLMSGLPIRRRYFMWILTVITWITITAITVSYVDSVVALTPGNNDALAVVIAAACSVLVWLLLIVLLLITHVIRFFIKLVRWLVKLVRKLGRRLRSVEPPSNLIA